MRDISTPPTRHRTHSSTDSTELLSLSLSIYRELFITTHNLSFQPPLPGKFPPTFPGHSLPSRLLLKKSPRKNPFQTSSSPRLAGQWREKNSIIISPRHSQKAVAELAVRERRMKNTLLRGKWAPPPGNYSRFPPRRKTLPR